MLVVVLFSTAVTGCGNATGLPDATEVEDVRALLEESIEPATLGGEPFEFRLEFEVYNGSSVLSIAHGVYLERMRGRLGVVREFAPAPGLVELRVRDRRAWLRDSDLAQLRLLPRGARWVEAPAEELRRLDVLSPEYEKLHFLYLLLGVTEVVSTGTGKAGDVPVRAYELRIDRDAARPAVPPELRDEVDEVPGLGFEEGWIEGSASVDADRRLREVELVAANCLPELGADSSSNPDDCESFPPGAGHRVTLRADFPVYGERQGVEPPPKASVVPLKRVPAVREHLTR